MCKRARFRTWVPVFLAFFVGLASGGVLREHIHERGEFATALFVGVALGLAFLPALPFRVKEPPPDG